MNSLSCDQAIELFSDVLADEIDSEKAALLEFHLASCKACCELAADFARQDVRIAHVVTRASTDEMIERLLRALNDETAGRLQVRSSASTPSEPLNTPVRAKPNESGFVAPDPLRRTRAKRVGRLLWGSLAASLLVGTLFFLVRNASVPGKGKSGTEKDRAAIARLERAEGEVRLTADGTEEVVQSGVAILSGQSVRTVGSGGFAIIRYPDSTRIEVGVDSELRDFQDGPETGKRLNLIRGTLLAYASKQRFNRPMIIRTPQAEATILGTTLRITVDQRSTRLQVLDGQVSLKRLADGKSVTVPSGHQAVAAVDVELIPIKTIGEWRVETTEGWEFSGDGTANIFSFAGPGKDYRPRGIVLTSEQSWDLGQGPLNVGFQWDINQLTRGFAIKVSFEQASPINAPPPGFPSLDCYHNGMILVIREGAKPVSTGFPNLVSFPAKVSATLHTDRVQGTMNALKAESAYVPFTGPVRVKISFGFSADTEGSIQFQGSLRDVRVTQLGK